MQDGTEPILHFFGNELKKKKTENRILLKYSVCGRRTILHNITHAKLYYATEIRRKIISLKNILLLYCSGIFIF